MSRKDEPHCEVSALHLADPELEAIRQRRMQELMARQGMLCFDLFLHFLDVTDIFASFLFLVIFVVARIALVKPEKSRGVEDVILRAAQMGQITEKVSEERLISLLEQINNQTTKQTKVTIQRRRSVLDDDD
ncbi:DNA-binding protein [Senna tora]|uniref:DNA-binding protein n=1 Tax=Senna tora TaxID=362788 RepID=A0A834SH23_9FABA|nr:DNA-binding protein [Senna tora]